MKKGMLIGVICVIVIGIAVAGVFFIQKKNKETATSKTTQDEPIREASGAGKAEGDTKVLGLNNQSVKITEHDMDLGAPTQHKAGGMDGKRIVGGGENKDKSQEAGNHTGKKLF